MGLDAFEWLSLISFLGIWWSNPFDSGASSYHMKRKYKTMKTKLPKSPGWFFLPVWIIVYTLVAISLWLFLNYSSAERGSIYDAVFGLTVVNYTLNKLWPLMFFTMGRYYAGSVNALLVFVTSAAMDGLLWAQGSLDTRAVVSSILLIPYVLWNLYMFVLSIDIASNNKSGSLFGSNNNDEEEEDSGPSDQDDYSDQEELENAKARRPRLRQGLGARKLKTRTVSKARDRRDVW